MTEMFLVVLACSTAALCLSSFWYYWKCIARYIYSGFPSTSYMFLISNFLTGRIPKDTPVTHFYFQSIAEKLKEFESEGLCLVWVLKPYLFIFGEEAVKIFSNETSALNKSSEYDVAQEFFGEGLGTCNSEVWHKRRKMLNPVFHVRMLKSKVDILNKNADVLVKSLMSEEDKSSLNILKFLQLCSFSNICEFVLGIKADDPKRSSDAKRFIELVEKCSKIITYRYFHPWTRSRHVLRLFPMGREYLKNVEEGLQIVKKILLDIKECVESRNATGENKETDAETYSSPRKSFAEILVDHHLKDPSYTLKDMVYETSSFTTAGYESVSVALTWCLFELGHHPEMQDIAYSEVEGLEANEISYDDMQKLKYLECFILETLRLYPTLPIYSRRLDKNVQCGKYDVPKGTTIVFFPYLYHRNSKIYPDPEKFDPERFLEESSEKRPWTHIPFSEGIRNCIGKKFALMEMKIILAHILRNFKVTSLDRKEDIQLSWEIVLTTVKPLRIRLTPRQ